MSRSAHAEFGPQLCAGILELQAHSTLGVQAHPTAAVEAANSTFKCEEGTQTGAECLVQLQLPVNTMTFDPHRYAF